MKKEMKRITYLLLALLLFTACEKTDDDSDLECTANCTRIEGRVFTKDNMPVKNAQMVFHYRKSNGFNSVYTRILAKAKTDSNGNYAMDFYVKDEELGAFPGSFELYMKKSGVRGDLFYHDDFSLWDNRMYSIYSRDTVMVRNLYLPTKKTVKVKLENFVPIAAGDMFQVQFHYPIGFETDEVNSLGNHHYYQLSGINQYMAVANAPSSTFDIKLADGEINFIGITKIKNGVYSEEEHQILLDADSPTEFAYSY